MKMFWKKLLVCVFVAVTALPKQDPKLKKFQKFAEISNKELDSLLTTQQNEGEYKHMNSCIILLVLY